jgi:hypothetical protein
VLFECVCAIFMKTGDFVVLLFGVNPQILCTFKRKIAQWRLHHLAKHIQGSPLLSTNLTFSGKRIFVNGANNRAQDHSAFRKLNV